MKPVSIFEVEEAVFQITEGKSLGLDGFIVNLFHHFWDLIKLEVWKIVEDSRVSRRILLDFNATFLTLITKSKRADSPDKFSPISLCNVIYKIITKVIANILKPLIPDLISPEKLGFVEGQHLTYGIILVHEMLHSLKNKKIPRMMVKLDVAKSYDKIN